MEDNKNKLIKCACGCRKLIPKYDKKGRERKYLFGHGRRRNFTDKEIKNIINMYSKENRLVSEIGKKYSCRFNTISKILKENKIEVKSKRDYSGKNNNFYGKKHTKETKDLLKKINQRDFIERFGEKKAVEIKENLRKILKGKTKNTKGKTYEEIYGKEKAEELKKLRALELKSRPIKKRTKKSRLKQSLSMKEKWKEKEYAERTLKAQIKGNLKRPTSFEQKIILLCSKYRLPFIYTGDGRILIGHKNPDFINKKNKVIIEVFLDYFKIRDYGSIENYMKRRSKHFAKYGYKTIFIREKEITAKNWEKICLNKIQRETNYGK